MASPGKQYVSGHNAREQERTEESRRKVSAAMTGERNHRFGRFGPRSASWKGGVLRHTNGYILEYQPDHPFAVKRYVMQHRLEAERVLRLSDPGSEFLVKVAGVQYISPKADVHHANEVKTDNRPENLVVMWKGDHTRHHAPALMAARWPKES
jgi:hypothetical protein